ncbi:MAG: pyridoxal 5'-phosphate synthase glutaminase subunit PdxT [Acidimicrobiia bacterium]|nr:pyridoxal 5'-phosphate synthase glutaminase subunit PdxT [Acidimicrobiia bacterium]NNF88544.1 pyridoxal 5'-phosphate synthase glutaminase subunit PdxT [Acidimicrobiia bacterium]NNJ48439.1 pyridoxal 5'-phosphate synthase glutaminase subunit PdxT [Acidimicrobiia bacterium]NNL14381.1 pyridoxal 5'-phosphate synthase glutaminase subunit PdxT [Acidimicrobiia bacterium]
MPVGILALQGDFREHAQLLNGMGVETRLVRKPGELDSIDGLVIPGGESTTIGKLADRYGLLEPLRRAVRSGVPTLGTCAGLIFLAAGTTGPAQIHLGVLDVVVERNAFGRQVDSFEAELDVTGLVDPLHAVFIRAPVIDKAGADVEILATVENDPVMVRQGNIIATSFHPELTGETRVHTLMLNQEG